MTLMERQTFLNIFLDPRALSVLQGADCQGVILCVGGRRLASTSAFSHLFSVTDEIPETAHFSYWHMHYHHTNPLEIHAHTFLPHSASYQSKLYFNMGRNGYVL